MKKIVFLLLLSIILFPAVLFGATPSDIEIQEATSVVLSTYGILFLDAMFGNIPDGVEADSDMMSGNSKLSFTNFNPYDYFLDLAERNGSTEEDMEPFSFKTMSGSVSVDENGSITCDMKLSGGNIKTLEFKTNDEDFDYIKVNGKQRDFMVDMIPFQ